MQIKPNRLVYKNPDTPAPAEAQKPTVDATPVHTEVKKAHETHRQELQDTLAPHIKSKNPKIRQAALDALDKLDELKVGYLTKATKAHFIAKYKVVIEAHGKKEAPSDDHRLNLRMDLSARSTSSNKKISTAAAKAIQELNKPENKNMTKAKAAEFMARHEVIFEYHATNEEAAKTIKEIKEVATEFKKSFKEEVDLLHKNLLKDYPNLTKGDKEKLVALNKATLAKVGKITDGMKTEYSQPTVSLEEYKKNPATLKGKLAKLKAAKSEKEGELQTLGSINHRPTAIAIIQNAVARNGKESIKELNKIALSSIEELKGLANTGPTKRKIAALAKNAKAQLQLIVSFGDDPDVQRVRAAILCQFHDDTTREIGIVRTGKVPTKREQPYTDALAKVYGRKPKENFKKFPQTVKNPVLAKGVGKPVKFKSKKGAWMFSEAGLGICSINSDRNVVLSSGDVYRFEGPGGKKVDYVRVRVGTNGPEGIIKREKIV